MAWNRVLGMARVLRVVGVGVAAGRSAQVTTPMQRFGCQCTSHGTALNHGGSGMFRYGPVRRFISNNSTPTAAAPKHGPRSNSGTAAGGGGAQQQGQGAGGGILAWYSKSLERRPLLTKVATATLLGLMGDVLAQTIQGAASLDFDRLGKFVFMQAAFVAPILHVW